jgi:hypothetical protein
MSIFKHAALGFGLILCIATLTHNEPVWAEMKQVCVDVRDRAGDPVKDKSGKVKQTCKTMKKHEKLEGTKVPEKK